MPESWYNWNANTIPKEDDPDTEENKKKAFNKTILAERKPYFMTYVYPAERSKYEKYVKQNNEKCVMRFRMSLDELISKENKTEEEVDFLKAYEDRMPVGVGKCIINRICWRIEEIFKDFKKPKLEEFDYSILKCDGIEYSKPLFNKVKTIYEEYKKELALYCQVAKKERIKDDARREQKYMLTERFRRKCLTVCPNEKYLCNIVLDLCYEESKNSKQFAWDVCGHIFVQNLLEKHDYKISYPTKDPNGDIEFDGNRFSMTTVDLRDCFEEDEDVEETEWE